MRNYAFTRLICSSGHHEATYISCKITHNMEIGHYVLASLKDILFWLLKLLTTIVMCMLSECACYLAGYVIYRVRVRRGGRKRPVPKGATYGKPVNQGVNQLKFQRSHRSIAEVRATLTRKVWNSLKCLDAKHFPKIDEQLLHGLLCRKNLGRPWRCR